MQRPGCTSLVASLRAQYLLWITRKRGECSNTVGSLQKLKEKITGLSTERSDLQAQVKDLSDIRDSLEV